MHSHGYFPRGNEKKTGVTFKDFKEYLYRYVIFIKSTVYVYRTTFSTVIRISWGRVGSANWKGGAYLIFLTLGEALIARGALI